MTERHAWEDHILLKYNLDFFFCIIFSFFSWLDNVDFPECRKAAIFPQQSYSLLAMKTWKYFVLDSLAQTIRRGLICFSLDTRIGQMKYLCAKQMKMIYVICFMLQMTAIEGRGVVLVSHWMYFYHHLVFCHHLDTILHPRPSNLPALQFCLTCKYLAGKTTSGAGLIWKLTARLHHVHYYAHVCVPVWH